MGKAVSCLIHQLKCVFVFVLVQERSWMIISQLHIEQL